MRVVVIDYGAGNLFSVCAALERLGCRAAVSSRPGEIAVADRVIFPGVGHAAPAMQRLAASGLDTLIPRLRMPVLGICLGMQLMCRGTEEGAVRGLGIFPAEARAITGGVRVPHMGWNNVAGLRTPLFDGVAEGQRMYFVHSYSVPVNHYTIAQCVYGEPFSAAMRRGNFFACQFHPEKSAEAGMQLLDNFLRSG